MSKKQWFLIAYGHQSRAEQAENEGHAMRLAFGLEDVGRMTIGLLPGIPRGLKRSALQAIQRRLAIEHFNHTGNIIPGYEKDPGICDRHWRECELCRCSIITAEAGGPEVCQRCQSKLDTLTQEEVMESSVANLRRKLGIKDVRAERLRVVQ